MYRDASSLDNKRKYEDTTSGGAPELHGPQKAKSKAIYSYQTSPQSGSDAAYTSNNNQVIVSLHGTAITANEEGRKLITEWEFVWAWIGEWGAGWVEKQSKVCSLVSRQDLAWPWASASPSSVHDISSFKRANRSRSTNMDISDVGLCDIDHTAWSTLLFYNSNSSFLIYMNHQNSNRKQPGTFTPHN